MKDERDRPGTAVAIKYLEGLPAPFILAKGRNELAGKLVKLAEDNEVAILQMPDLADALYLLDPGSYVPEEYYQIMAELLAYVYRIRKER